MTKKQQSEILINILNFMHLLTQKILSYPSWQIGQFKDAIILDDRLIANKILTNLKLQTSTIACVLMLNTII